MCYQMHHANAVEANRTAPLQTEPVVGARPRIHHQSLGVCGRLYAIKNMIMYNEYINKHVQHITTESLLPFIHRRRGSRVMTGMRNHQVELSSSQGRLRHDEAQVIGAIEAI